MLDIGRAKKQFITFGVYKVGEGAPVSWTSSRRSRRRLRPSVGWGVVKVSRPGRRDTYKDLFTGTGAGTRKGRLERSRSKIRYQTLSGGL